MHDLETLGLSPSRAPIIQGAAVAFELHGDGPVAGVRLFQYNVDATSQLAAPFHRVLNPSTIAWWAKTDAPLLVEIMEGRGLSLNAFLTQLSIWCHDLPIDGVWANGATFDISMLESAYEQAGLTVPWHFRTIRDVRTMAMIAGDDDACWKGGTITETEASGRKHDALVDCLRQVRMVQQTWQRRIIHEAPAEVCELPEATA